MIHGDPQDLELWTGKDKGESESIVYIPTKVSIQNDLLHFIRGKAAYQQKKDDNPSF